MIQRRLLHVCLFLITVSNPFTVLAENANQLLRLGDSAYVRKRYDSAVVYYQQAVTAVNPDPVVLYKLGNAHFRLDQVGPAVLAYERALKHRPGYADAAENLALIQRRIQPQADIDQVFLIRWWHAMTRPSLGNVWAALGIIFFSIPLGMLIWGRLRRKWPSWLWPQAVIGGMALSVLFTLLAAASVPETPRDHAVVMNTAAFRGNSGSGQKDDVLQLPEGLVVKVLVTTAKEVRVALPDGREGFVQPDDLAFVD